MTPKSEVNCHLHKANSFLLHRHLGESAEKKIHDELPFSEVQTLGNKVIFFTFAVFAPFAFVRMQTCLLAPIYQCDLLYNVGGED